MLCQIALVPKSMGGRDWPLKTSKKYKSIANIKTGRSANQAWSIVVDFRGLPGSGIYECEFLVKAAPRLSPGDRFEIIEGLKTVAVCEVTERARVHVRG